MVFRNDDLIPTPKMANQPKAAGNKGNERKQTLVCTRREKQYWLTARFHSLSNYIIIIIIFYFWLGIGIDWNKTVKLSAQLS